MNGIGAITSITRFPVGASTAAAGAGSIGGAAGIAGGSPVDGTAAGSEAPGTSFLNALGEAFNSLNGQLGAADAAMADFASGGSADLHTVMLQMEEASISLKAGVQIRDKLLEAYQEIMRTQL